MAISIIEQLKIISILIKEPAVLKALLSQKHSGYLLDQGWFNSYKKREPFDKFGNPIPWMSYPSIDFLEERLKPNLNLFEYGSGNSTFYYATKVLKVTSVEHDNIWFSKIKKKLPANVELIFSKFEPDKEYCKMSKNINEKFDIIIVDGVDRNNCLKYSVEALSPSGVLILDDSERKEYFEGTEYIIKNKFKKIDFWGIAPGILFKKCTTIFYKNNNCLGI